MYTLPAHHPAHQPALAVIERGGNKKNDESLSFGGARATMEKPWGPNSWQINWQRSNLTTEALTTRLREALAAGAAAEVETILLNSNQLESLPFDELAQFTKCTNLSANDNALTSVAGLARMTQLKVVQLGSNKLTAFPDDVLALAHLDTLGLYNNAIPSLPSGIGRLANLTFLNLGTNSIEHLPSEIGTIPRLKTLYLHENKLVALPVTLRNLPLLENLGLRDNPLPAELARTVECDKAGAGPAQVKWPFALHAFHYKK